MRFFNFRRPFDTSSARSRAALMGMGFHGQMAVGIEERAFNQNTSFPTDYGMSAGRMGPMPAMSPQGSMQEQTPDLSKPFAPLPTFQTMVTVMPGVPVPSPSIATMPSLMPGLLPGTAPGSELRRMELQRVSSQVPVVTVRAPPTFKPKTPMFQTKTSDGPPPSADEQAKAEKERKRQAEEAQRELDKAATDRALAETEGEAAEAEVKVEEAEKKIQAVAQKSQAQLADEGSWRKWGKWALWGFVGFGVFKLLTR